MSLEVDLKVVCRDIGALPSSDNDLKVYCQTVLGNELYAEILQVRKLAAGGMVGNQRVTPDPDMIARQCTVEGSIRWKSD